MMGGFRSALLRKAAEDMVSEFPERHPAFEARLQEGLRTPEGAGLLRVFGVLLTIPMGDAVDEFKPGIRRLLEDMALQCEVDDAEGAAQRAWGQDFLARLREAVAPVGSLNDVFPGRVREPKA